jgi:hypothetical protein
LVKFDSQLEGERAEALKLEGNKYCGQYLFFSFIVDACILYEFVYYLKGTASCNMMMPMVMQQTKNEENKSDGTEDKDEDDGGDNVAASLVATSSPHSKSVDSEEEPGTADQRETGPKEEVAEEQPLVKKARVSVEN